jgi:hypothetical protein
MKSALMSSLPLPALLQQSLTSRQETVAAASQRAPQLLVFLRHGGCPFCRQMLSRLQQQRATFARQNVELVLVHLQTPEAAERLFAEYGLSDVAAISDPGGELASACGMQRGGVWDFAGPAVWGPGLQAVLQGHFPSIPDGDVCQLPGACVVVRGEIVARHVGRHSADLPDPIALLTAAGIRHSQSTSVAGTTSD